MKTTDNKPITKADLTQVVTKIVTNVVTRSQAELARMIAKGFEQTATKTDLAELRSDLTEVNQKVELINDRLDHVAYKFEVKDLQARVTKLEQKAV